MRALLVVLLVVGFLARYAVWITAVLGAVVVFVAECCGWRSVWRAASIPSMRNTPCWWTAPISNTPGYSPAATVAGTANTRRTKIVPSAAARDGPGMAELEGFDTMGTTPENSTAAARAIAKIRVTRFKPSAP
jgi:hypothetical protein